MRTVEDAQRCIDQLNGVSLQGRAIRVDFSATRKPHNPTPGQYMGERKPMREWRTLYMQKWESADECRGRAIPPSGLWQAR